MCTVRYRIECVSIELTNEQNNEDKADPSRVLLFIPLVETYYENPGMKSTIVHGFKRIRVI